MASTTIDPPARREADAPRAEAPAPSAAPAAPAAPAKKRGNKRFIFLFVLAAVATAGVVYWLHARHYEDTDDAQIDANISNVSPRVAGTIKTVLVRENQVVKAGDLLAEIDTTDLEVAVALAKAAVVQAEAQLKAEDPSVAITQASNESAVTSASSDLSSSAAAVSAAKKEVVTLTAQLAQAQSTEKQAILDKQRAEKLYQSGSLAQADYDKLATAATNATAAVQALESSIAAAKDRISEANARAVAASGKLTEIKTNAPMQIETRKATVAVRQANLDAARAQLKQAELNVGYAKIVAPVSGIVGKKSFAVGDHVAPGQQILAIAQIDDVWVTANFRETQLARMTPGQPVSIHVDALDIDLRGTVESIGGATGAKFSVLPPENASGNYVKVVQRIPVRIRIEPGQGGIDRLRPGMSVEPEVKVR